MYSDPDSPRLLRKTLKLYLGLSVIKGFALAYFCLPAFSSMAFFSVILLPPVYSSIECMPVGRLDKDTTGLLVLTCDGEMNHRLLAPGRHVDKVYEARVTGRLTEKEKEAFAAGLDLSDFTAQPAELEILEAGEAESRARVTVAEGKFHQIKRMFSATGHEVLTLHRSRFGPLALDPALAEGEWRELTDEELAALRAAAGMAPAG